MNIRHLRRSFVLAFTLLMLTGAVKSEPSIAQEIMKDDKVVTIVSDSKVVETKEVIDEWYIPQIKMDYEEQKFLHSLCEKTNYPYFLALAQIKYESGFKSDCVGSSGELGYMQILPSWNKYLEQELNKKIDLNDSYSNLESGILLMRYNVLAQDKYDGREMYIRSLNVYNQGSSNYRNYCKNNVWDSWHYGKNIWKIYQEYLKGNYDYEVRK